MSNVKFLKIVNQNILVKHLMKVMGEEIYSGLFTRKSLKTQRKKVVKELDRLISMANKDK